MSKIEMNIENIEQHFSSYLDKFWKLSDIAPFILVYIQLLLLFKKELSQAALNVILERQKQIRGEEFESDGFDDLMNSSRKDLDRNLGSDTSMTREAILNRMMFCALIDTEENDFFYLTEPLFEFVREMGVSPNQLQKILESEFTGFKI